MLFKKIDRVIVDVTEKVTFESPTEGGRGRCLKDI